MVEGVYGQMPLETLRERAFNPMDCDAGVVRGANKKAERGVAGFEPVSQPADLLGFKVPGTGIEPVTRGFSGRVVDWARPRLHGRNST
jgi:hypothetical protein